MKPLAEGMYRILGEGALSVLSKAQMLEREGKTILHFEIGQPDFPTANHIKEEAKKAIEKNFTSYVAAEGILELKKAIQDAIEATRGYIPSLNQILVLPGAKPGVFFTMLATVNPGDEVIYPDPGFPTYGSVSKYLNAKEVPIPLREENEFRLNPADIEEEITPNTKLIILNSPQNPTGSVMTKKELEEVALLAEEQDVFVLADEIYSKNTYDIEFYSATTRDKAKERTVLLDGFSKSYSMTGWRLGYIVGPEPLIEKMTKVVMNAISCTTSFVQKAGVVALKGRQDELKTMMNTFRKRRDAIVKGLNTIPGFSCLTPQGAFYVFPSIKETGMKSNEIADLLLYEAGVACLPGTAFGSKGEGYLRFSYATSIETINRALKEIKKVFG